MKTHGMNLTCIANHWWWLA